MKKKNKLICNIGINDADYVVKPVINGKRLCCPFYQAWRSMMTRCYSEKLIVKNPTYNGCSVCDEWLTFSNFKKWMEQQDWKGKQLDKDLLFVGNKVYSPETCVFVDYTVNSFITDCGATRGEWPIGVDFHKNGKFQARCSNPFTNENAHLGYFTCPNEAHLVWKKRKRELSCQLAELQSDIRVAKALRERYAPDTDWTNR